jgi:RNA chaperone Hfq
LETNLLDRMLTAYQHDRVPVIVTLQNRSRVTGTVSAFDGYLVVMDGRRRELVYRHAISSVAPAAAPEEHKVPSVASQPAVTHAGPSPQPQRQQFRRELQTVSPQAESINGSMREGLLRWMEDQRAVK